MVEKKQSELIMLQVKNKKFNDAAKIYLELDNKYHLLDVLQTPLDNNEFYQELVEKTHLKPVGDGPRGPDLEGGEKFDPPRTEMDECEKILKALVDAKKDTHASELAIWLGDRWVEYDDLPRAEADYITAYEKSASQKDKYDKFVQHQKLLEQTQLDNLKK